MSRAVPPEACFAEFCLQRTNRQARSTHCPNRRSARSAKKRINAAQPRSSYAVQKLVGEYYARIFWQVHGVETVSLRYFNVFGPRQDPSSPYSGVLSLFCAAVFERRAPTIFGDGEQSQDFTFVDDIVRLNLLAADSPRAPGNVYNGGTGSRHTLNEVWAVLEKIEQPVEADSRAPERREVIAGPHKQVLL